MSAALSPAQLRVLGWAYYGKTNGEIAEILGISEYTVKNHVQAVIRKLEVPDRTRAVTAALERGIIALRPHDAQQGG